MKVTGDWLTNPASQAVCAMLESAGFQAFFVGGCVRNALIGAPVGDIDISTNAHPETVMRLARSAGFNAVPTGIDHGTVTVVARHIPHEITTFRKDVETDGRRAVVAFADTMESDARRRDFTMNALYADSTGLVSDPVGGLPDLLARYVRFIDDANARIQEDYLRTLRFFRFNAWYGDPQSGFDPDALAAIAANLDGLETLSRERVGVEMLKLFGAEDPSAAVAVMRSTGVLTRLLPGANDTALGPLTHLEKESGAKPDPVLRLAVLGGEDIADRLRLSRANAKKLAFFQGDGFQISDAGELGYRFGATLAHQALILRAATMQTHLDAAQMSQAKLGAAAVFPVKSSDLMPQFSGAALGQKLRSLEQRWIASGFTLTRKALLSDD